MNRLISIEEAVRRTGLSTSELFARRVQGDPVLAHTWLSASTVARPLYIAATVEAYVSEVSEVEEVAA